MKRLVALLLVCVLALSSTLALADENEISTFTPESLKMVEESQGYTKFGDWLSTSATRAVFSILIYSEYLKATGDEMDLENVDWEKNTFVIANSSTIGFVYCEKDGEYKALYYIPTSGIAGYDPSFSMGSDETVLETVLKNAGFLVYQNSVGDMEDVVEVLIEASSGDN